MDYFEWTIAAPKLARSATAVNSFIRVSVLQQTTPRKKWRTQLQPVVDSEEDLVLAAVPVVAAEDADGAVVVDAVAVVAARKTPRSGFQ